MPMYLPTFDSSLSYSWVGNQWQPPSGVPLYTIQEMRHIFTQGNVLWIGDSTARQDYVTLYNMITSSSSTHDDDHYYSNLTVAQLNEGINVNKGGKITEICDRRYPLDLLLCRDIGNATVNNKIVHYDYTEQICFRDVFNYINTNWRQLVAKYSTILVSVGIWDVIRFQYCGGQNVTFVRDVLNVIDEKFSANGHVQVLWKVHCGAGNENASEMDRTAQIQQLTRDWFATHPQNNHTNNMAMIDLAKEMEGRTYGEARIAGDIPPHLGPTARMLFLQMATHEMAQQKGRSLTKNRTI
ncbi:hypothetical protein IV203_004542 [Nitzschia inconspicua]|uniref:Uncharacterized protein n=1 Tax=Nitzschia inconspicua TaxID=303405 RepID=A0A9K3L5I3_9STRA|nr:hypothetical protein IV203_004542 [Nitzschia inconspicua]